MKLNLTLNLMRLLKYLNLCRCSNKLVNVILAEENLNKLKKPSLNLKCLNKQLNHVKC